MHSNHSAGGTSIPGFSSKRNAKPKIAPEIERSQRRTAWTYRLFPPNASNTRARGLRVCRVVRVTGERSTPETFCITLMSGRISLHRAYLRQGFNSIRDRLYPSMSSGFFRSCFHFTRLVSPSFHSVPPRWCPCRKLQMTTADAQTRPRVWLVERTGSVGEQGKEAGGRGGRCRIEPLRNR